MAFPWYALCVVFLLPFVDWRNPFRLLHLDLLVLLVVGLRPLRTFLVGGAVSLRAVGLTVACLLYLLGRLVWSALHPRKSHEPLVPFVPVAWLAVGVVLLTAFRVSYVVTDHARVIDEGQASVIGADRIAHGRDLYGGGLGRIVFGGDTYGPVTYLAYVPFEQAFPVSRHDAAPYAAPTAAPAAAMTFDLLTIFALLLMGRRLRPGREGKALGVALAYAWASYPYSFLVLRDTFNDALLALLILGALFAASRPVGRGALTALAAATKFAPGVLAPLFATGTGERRLRSSLLFAAAFVVVSLLVFLPFVPSGGIHELYDRTIGFQRARGAWMTIWGSVPGRGDIPGRDWLQPTVQVAALCLALLFAVVPRRKTVTQLAALGAALLIASQLAATNWAPNYLVWFAPLAFIGLFAAYDTTSSGRPLPLQSALSASGRARSG